MSAAAYFASCFAVILSIYLANHHRYGALTS
jgi:hypothetical protein